MPITLSEIVFDTPMEECTGVRLVLHTHDWDVYGESVNVRGDIFVVGASKWNYFGAARRMCTSFQAGNGAGSSRRRSAKQAFRRISHIRGEDNRRRAGKCALRRFRLSVRCIFFVHSDVDRAKR